MSRFLHPAHAQCVASTRFLCQWMKTRVPLRGPSGDLVKNHFHRTSRTEGQRRTGGKNWGDAHTLLFVSISWHFGGESYWPRGRTARVFWWLTKSLFLKLQMIVGKTDGKCADGNGDGKTQGRLHKEEKQQARKKVKTKIWNLNIATSEGHLAIKAEARWGSPVARTPTPGETAPWETMRRVSESHRNPSCGPSG